jgi:adenosylcobinamide-GDP ribazoletransferase
MFGDALHDFKVALVFLTRLPIPLTRPWRAEDLAGSAMMFPVVGALVGLAGGLVYALSWRLGLTSFLAALAAIAVVALLTGAMHEDGLADVADGFGGGRTCEDALRIMRDSRIGTFGALALLLVVLARTGALASLAEPEVVLPAMVVAAAVSRATLPALLLALPAARPDGLAVAAGRPHRARVAAGAALACLLALALLGAATALAGLLAAGLLALLMAALARDRIGGITGDVLGAAQQLTELGFLLVLVSVKT